jgi:hypothetical protein
MQLALCPLTKAEWQPMLNKAIASAPPWQRGLLVRAGRLVQVKTVTAAKPIHQLLFAEAPVWLCVSFGQAKIQ